MNNFTLWGSTDGFSKYIFNNTILKNGTCSFKYLPESDAGKPKLFHKLPTHIKNIQYLDSPDLIIELDNEPILSIEISREAGTGHNVFQRFARLAAAVENNVPSIYIYPEAALITRKNTGPKWDAINPLIFFAIEKLSRIYPQAPALLYYYPSYYRTNPNSKSITPANKGLLSNIDVPVIDSEMGEMFDCINEILLHKIKGKKTNISTEPLVSKRTSFMHNEYYSKGGAVVPNNSPISSTIEVPSSAVLNYFSKVKKGIPSLTYFDETIWTSRDKTIIYKINAKFRGDPYPGCIAALDYILTRTGLTFEDRSKNLVIAWGDVKYDSTKNELTISPSKNQSINDLFDEVNKNDNQKNILSKNYASIPFEQLPRYFMQLRFGSTFSKPKHIRVYSYFSDAILFPDGAIWREC